MEELNFLKENLEKIESIIDIKYRFDIYDVLFGILSGILFSCSLFILYIMV